MKTLTKTFKSTLIACLFLATAITFAQTTVNNNPNTSTDFTDLQAAIDAATNGDVIYVQQSPTNYGNIIINKELTIIGRSHSDNGYRSQIGTIFFDAGASNTSIKGLKMNGLSDQSSANATITNLTIFDNDISGINIGSSKTYDNILIQGNIIRSSINIRALTSNVLLNNNIIFSSSISFFNTATLLFSNNVMPRWSGITFNNSTSGLLNIDNCIFINNTNADRTVTLNPGSGSIQVNNCITYNYNVSGTYVFTTGTGITINANNQENTDPLFTNVDPSSLESIATASNTLKFDPANDDLTLQAGSPVNDDGLFQGYNFKNFGTPTGYPSLKVDSYSSTVPKNSDLTVTITAKTN